MSLKSKVFRLFFLLLLVSYATPTLVQTQSNPDSIPFAPAVNYGAGDGPSPVFCADLDGDTNLDLAVASRWTNGDGTFQTKVDFALADIGFLNKNPATDNTILSKSAEDIMSGGIENSDNIIIDEIKMPRPHKFIDYNKDGILDLVRKEVDGKIYLYINKGSNKAPVYMPGVLYEEEIILEEPKPLKTPKISGLISWVHLPYDRFDVYIDSVYYNNNTPAIDDFFDEFEERYALLESWTDWSAEEYYGKKLRIMVSGTPGGCYGGTGGNGVGNLIFSDPLYMTGCQDAYYENGIPHFGNPGELGDWWRFMGVAMHEATHAINPKPILKRVWLAEGWASYHEFNIPSMYYGNSYPDINQETADHYIYQGDSGYNWEDYVANDYHDNSLCCKDWSNYYIVSSCDGYFCGPYDVAGCASGYGCVIYYYPTDSIYHCVKKRDCEIQESAGYRITAHMFTMLRDNYNLNWSDFYSIMDNNPETLKKAMVLGGPEWSGNSIYTDMHVIDLFEMATGTPMYPVFRYDGPSGPGWGVRNWTDLNWYADLTPVLEVSDTIPKVGDSIWLNTTIYNNGGVSLNDVVVRFYSNSALINEQVVSVVDTSFTTVSTQYSAPVGSYNIRVIVDEDNLKIEKDDSNNEDSELVSFEPYIRGDVDGNGGINLADVIYLANYILKGGPAPIPLQSGDVNCDGKYDLVDVIKLARYVLFGEPFPC